MSKRAIKPCNMLPLWGLGGTLLGGVTALLGREAILVCTEAVERTVHRHMADQVAWLGARDTECAALIDAIRIEEIEHLHQASGARTRRRRWHVALDLIVSGATESLVWASTYGASGRLRRLLARRVAP